MQRARDYSETRFCRFYPSHEDRTSLTTNHPEIGVFWHPHHQSKSRFIRDSERFPLHQQASNDENPPDFAVHALPRGMRESAFQSQRRLRERAQLKNPFLIGPSQFDEFDDYERAYNNSVPRWHLRAVDRGDSLLPVFVAHQPSVASNPSGYMSSVLGGFARFDNPAELMTNDEVKELNDLLGSALDARYETGYGPDGKDSLVGSLLNAKRSRLEPDNLFASMRLLAEKVLERSVLASQTAGELGLSQAAYDNEMLILDNFIGSILDVRQEYIQTGDIGANEEMFANFDSKQDADDLVDIVPTAFNFVYNPTQLRQTDAMILKLKNFIAATIPNAPNRLDVAIKEMRALEQLPKPTAAEAARKRELAQLIAQLRQVEGLIETKQFVTTVVTKAERAKAAILTRRKEITQLNSEASNQIATAQARVRTINAALKNLPKGDPSVAALETEKQTLFRLVKNQQNIVSNNAIERTTLAQAELDEENNVREAVKKVAEDVAKTRGLGSFRARLPKKVRKTPLQPELYERAISLVMVDLVEKELRALDFSSDKRSQVEDAVSTIENVRFQLPDGSKHELARFAGRGTLPFALVAKSSSLSKKDVTTGYRPASQTQTTIDRLISD